MDPTNFARQSRWQRPPVLIVGAHRSGTSATAAALKLLGLQLGHRLDSHDEPKTLQRLHEDYLHQFGAAWHNPAPFLSWIESGDGERHAREYLHQNVVNNFSRVLGYRKNPKGLWLWARLKMGKTWGWKEPRTTLFAPLWLQLFPNARVLDVIRHPLSVATSIRKRELEFRAAGDSPTLQLEDVEYCLQLALTYVKCGAQLANISPNYRRIRFEDVQKDPSGSLKTLAEFCGLRPTRALIAQAAATIRKDRTTKWDGLTDESARELISRYPMIETLGYGWQKVS
jgi:hypothetical protein